MLFRVRPQRVEVAHHLAPEVRHPQHLHRQLHVVLAVRGLAVSQSHVPQSRHLHQSGQSQLNSGSTRHPDRDQTQQHDSAEAGEDCEAVGDVGGDGVLLDEEGERSPAVGG